MMTRGARCDECNEVRTLGPNQLCHECEQAIREANEAEMERRHAADWHPDANGDRCQMCGRGIVDGQVCPACAIEPGGDDRVIGRWRPAPTRSTLRVSRLA